MLELAQKTLDHWGMAGAEVSLVAQRENVVFRVAQDGRTYALRLHRPGYQTAAMMASELDWMQHLGTQGVVVPTPLPTQTGALLIEVEGHHADLLTWLPGQPLGSTGKPLVLKDREGTFAKIGDLMAHVHQISDAWDLPRGFERRAWDIEGLLGEAPLWDRFWDNPGLSSDAKSRVIAARDALRVDLTEKATDFGLIHADMLRENVMIDGDALGLIDFDDSGFGFRLFDVATTLLKNRTEPDYDALQAAFLSGYRTVRPLNTDLLDSFMLIRALSYMGWIISRMAEPGAADRQKRFIKTALPMVDAYLQRQD